MTWATLALIYPEFDPVAFSIGPFVVRWYALAYIVGLTLGWQYCRAPQQAPAGALEPRGLRRLSALGHGRRGARRPLWAMCSSTSPSSFCITPKRS